MGCGDGAPSPCRVALEQAIIYLPTSEACNLGSACRLLWTFLNLPDKSCAYWFEPVSGIWASYDEDSAWFHLLADLRLAASYLKQLRKIQVKGPLEFQSTKEVEALISSLTDLTGEVSCCKSHCFAVSWVFNPSCVDKMFRYHKVGSIVSEPVRFRCNYGVAFDVTLGVAKTSSCDSAFEIGIASIAFAGNYLAPIEVRAAVRFPLLQALGINQVCSTSPNFSTELASATDHMPQSITFELDEGGQMEFLSNAKLWSLLRVDVPNWCKPVS
mmetsp:Transcript_127865/g.239101  ORF Transcript_127865/g.239101 Transcript_127865/m.239101 type:complete len:271 (+) Transcript_127865:36-848(+)